MTCFSRDTRSTPEDGWTLRISAGAVTHPGALCRFEDVKGLDKLVEEINKKNNWEVGIHVDGASGGFVAPFVYPDLEWDFRVKNVVSINASGHK